MALNQKWQITYVNSQAAQVLQQDMNRLVGRQFWDVIPFELGQHMFEKYDRALREKSVQSFEAQDNQTQDWFEIRAYPASEGISVFFQTITTRKQAEQALQNMNQELENRVEARTHQLVESIKVSEERRAKAEEANRTKLERLLTRIFIELNSIASRKNILLNAGVDEYIIATMDFNLNINEFTTNLVAKLKNYCISTNKPEYHPLVALLSYILFQPERFNLDEDEMELCDRIINIGKKYNSQVNEVERKDVQNKNNTSETQIGKFIINIKEGKDIHIGDNINDSNQNQDVSDHNQPDNSSELSEFIKQLEYAQSQGEEGDRNTGSYYTYKVWLADVFGQKKEGKNMRSLVNGDRKYIKRSIYLVYESIILGRKRKHLLESLLLFLRY